MLICKSNPMAVNIGETDSDDGSRKLRLYSIGDTIRYLNELNIKFPMFLESNNNIFVFFAPSLSAAH